MREAVAVLRSGKRPGVRARAVIRPYAHSMSDDEKLYRRRRARVRRGAIRSLRIPDAPKKEGVATDEQTRRVANEVDAEIEQAAEPALPPPRPSNETAALCVYSPNVDPTSESNSRPSRGRRRAPDDGDAINWWLRDEMTHNPRIVVFGEDVADVQRARAISTGARQGRRVQGDARTAAAFGEQARLQLAARRGEHRGPRHGHGHTRSQAGGRDAVLRLHLAGHDADSQRAGDDALALGQQLFSCPLVIRVPIGGYLRGGGPYHSQWGERIFAHCPGLRVAIPPTRWTLPVSCARRFAATTRCCSSSTSISIASPTPRGRTRGRSSRCRSAGPRCVREGTGSRSSPGARWCSDRFWLPTRRARGHQRRDHRSRTMAP